MRRRLWLCLGYRVVSSNCFLLFSVLRIWCHAHHYFLK